MSSPAGPQHLGIMQYAATLADFASLIRDQNRWLQSRTVTLTAVGRFFSSNPSRVAIFLTSTLRPVDLAAALDVRVGFTDDASTLIQAFSLITKEADVAAVTPSPFLWQPPLFFSILSLGPLVQSAFRLTLATGLNGNNVTATEIVFSGPNQPWSPDQPRPVAAK